MNILSQIKILELVLGLAFFLFGMHVMSSNLEKMAGGKLEHMLKKMTSNPFVSLMLGAAITIAVQSSSATTVMLVGLVNSGIMQFSQTLYVIFGANIGTTLTSWILSLSSLSSDNFFVMMLKPKNFSPIVALIGVILLMAAKTDKKKSIGTIMVGFAVLMYGMEFMSGSVRGLADVPEFGELMLKFQNPLLGVLVGTLFTALIQSSAASVGVLQALALTGAVNYNIAIPIIMGQNIGTCVTAMISGVGANANAKRVATIHLSLNVIGTVVLLSLYSAARAIFTFTLGDTAIDAFGIAVVHTIFNIAITILLMPFGKWILKLATVMVRDDKKPVKQAVVQLDERLFRSPSIAINECDSYTVKMCELAVETLNLSIDMLSNYDEKLAQKVLDNEDMLDKYEDGLGTYLVKLSGQSLSSEDSQRISKMLHTIGDFERLGDHAVNLLKTAQEMHEKQTQFSEQGGREITVLTEAIREILTITNSAYAANDVAISGRVEPLEQVIDDLTAAVKNNHILRLQEGSCTIETGFILSDILNNYERISDHCSNIAVAIIELVHNTFDTHQYLNRVKTTSEEFSEVYDQFSHRFAL